MNLLLLEDSDFVGDDIAQISGRRYEHIVNILRLSVGSELKTGVVNGHTGVGTIIEIEQKQIRLKVTLIDRSEPTLPVTVLLALPRPKMLKRILQNCASLGVARLYLINSYRVEKSYWQSPWLDKDAIRQQLLLGLEQAGTTTLPSVILRKRFKPFVEDELEAIATDTERLVAQPGSNTPAPIALNKPATLAIGPEGGFIRYEVDKLSELGFTPVSLGRRILKVETAITAILSRLYT